MGSVFKSAYTTPMPEGATVCGEIVTWTTNRGKKKTGKLVANGGVRIETSKWVAEWIDESGTAQSEATGCTSKEMALHFLRNKEMEVERIKAGFATCQEIKKSQQNIPHSAMNWSFFNDIKSYMYGALDDF
jgi:uncharacterized protein with beta-barrel porin domain